MNRQIIATQIDAMTCRLFARDAYVVVPTVSREFRNRIEGRDIFASIKRVTTPVGSVVLINDQDQTVTPVASEYSMSTGTRVWDGYEETESVTYDELASVIDDQADILDIDLADCYLTVATDMGGETFYIEMIAGAKKSLIKVKGGSVALALAEDFLRGVASIEEAAKHIDKLIDFIDVDPEDFTEEAEYNV
nr:MAG TPA: hypothetical protein [Caudoviricetes sp.]